MTGGGRRLVVHVAQVEITRSTGMGRVAWHWRAELERRGYEVMHLGPAAVGRPVHPALFPFVAWRRFRRLGVSPDAVLVHEPAGLPFLAARCPVIVFSHGLERRGWQAALAAARDGAMRPGAPDRIRRRSRLLFPLWRLWPAERALRRASAVMVLNRDDREYVRSRYGRQPADVFLFRNGVTPVADETSHEGAPDILFLGSWISRKGTATLIAAARRLHESGLAPRYVLAGTGRPASEILAEWPAALRPAVSVVPQFDPDAEAALFADRPIFVLPSFFEGQPLSLLQAMAAGCACVGSDIAGTRDLIADGTSGLLHAPGDSSGLAAALAECLQSPARRAELGDNARRAVAGRTWPAVAAEAVDFILERAARRTAR